MFIPGRIEVLGKHTDYCGGRSIVCAIDRGFHLEVESAGFDRLVIENLDISEKVEIDLRDAPARPGHWSNYVVEVLRRVTKNFGPLRGTSIRFHSDLPKAAGLSSSSALMIMAFAALDEVNDLRSRDPYRENIVDELQLAEYLGCVENGQSYHALAGSVGVGTFGGSQDHAAIMLGKTGKLCVFSFSPLRFEDELQFPETHAFVVASSGVSAEKTGTARDKYNRVSNLVTEITTKLGGQLTLSQLIEEYGIEETLDRVRAIRSAYSTRELLERVEQFRIENFEIIPEVIDLLRSGRIDDLGDAIDLSQENAERFLGNQIGETSFLQRSARDIGAVAASAFGAGFGGSVYAIVKRAEASDFMEEWRRVYVNRYPDHLRTSEFFVTRPSESTTHS
jgi:galactokinase